MHKQSGTIAESHESGDRIEEFGEVAAHSDVLICVTSDVSFSYTNMPHIPPCKCAAYKIEAAVILRVYCTTLSTQI